MNKRFVRLGALVAAVLLGGFLANARVVADSDQTTPSSSARVVYGHHHLNVTSIDEHRKFWVDGLGGVPVTLEGLPSTIIRFPGVLVFLRQQAPKGDMRESVVPRVGFDVKSLAAATVRLKTAGYPVVTSGPSSAGAAGTVVAPDGLELELVEHTEAHEPIRLRDVQFNVEDPEAVSAWYARMFGVSVSPRRSPLAATLPNLTMVFRLSKTHPMGTQGRVLDHIGFEVEHLEAFCADLRSKGVTFDRPYTKLPTADLAIAFLTDPWGTYIELTEGLNRVQ